MEIKTGCAANVQWIYQSEWTIKFAKLYVSKYSVACVAIDFLLEN